MKHDKAVERTKAIIAKSRCKPQRTGAGFKSDLADAEALKTLLAAVAHMPVGGDGEPLWSGQKVFGVVWLSELAGGRFFSKLSEVFSTREAAEKGGAK